MGRNKDRPPTTAARAKSWEGISARYLMADGVDLSWQQHAACRFHDPEDWHPVGTSGPALAQAEKAKAVCRECPVLMSCAAWAVDALEYGIAGAMDEEQRRGLRRASRRNARALANAS